LRAARILALAALACGPAGAGAQSGPATAAVDAATLMADVRVLAHDSMQGRAVGTPGNAKARAFLLRRFRDVGLEPFGDSFERPFAFTGRGAGAGRQGVNLVGVVRGRTRPDHYLVVTAHYDHVGVRDGVIFNGADDNASGAAALLALAEALRREPAEHSVIIAALDAEESGLRGARAFLADPPVQRSAILANLNMDMLSRSDEGELWVAGTHHYPQLLPLIERVARRAPVKLRTGHDRPGVPDEDDWTTLSDHGPFHAAGIPFLYLGVEDHADYHKPTDDADRIAPEFYANAVATTLDVLREMDAFFSR
jgi:Zn-dependent M28 family amino/carboxypeptidase